MILKWKTILTNWINCYTTEGEKGEHNITPENLLNIFTHIHESFRLDDSKSSKFEANTIQDFISEKYPEFKFENGTLEATCEEEVYIVASLLLFFICVNSKNADIKRVMCSKLSVGDQETIMKFSKCLMDCSPILYADVEAAISEACGDVSNKVAETPPALRSLHGEVRRLQAALDAERFDRNYLQDELARTNLKLEKLTKVKEQYKLDILSLKAKISLCCGEQKESHREARADEFIGRLQRQLHDLEGRLEDTLGQLEDIQQERDSYKQKVADLKQERDKWLSLSQLEADKAGQLADQLDTERRTVATLRDLVSELRQHNRNNGLDSSMLECDDPDTSIQSLNNLSVCNEACANVIEVQLGEERAKIEILKQQIQSLQEQLCKANETFESDKLSLEAVISEKETNCFRLKQRVDEEIEEKNNLKTHSELEIDKLNKKIIEMSLIIKDVEEISKNALAEKAQEIQLLHKNFTDETVKLGNVIQNLHKQIEDERTLKKNCEEEILRLDNKIHEMLQTIKHIEERSIQVLSAKEQQMRSMEHQFANETEKSHNVLENLQKELNEQNKLRTRCEHEIVKLKSKVVEISQMLNDVELSSKHALSEKEQKIRSMVEQFEVETEKSNNTIKHLQEELNEQSNLKTRYEHKVVELKNKIVEISQTLQDVELSSKHVLEDKEQQILTLKRQFESEIEKSECLIEGLQKEIKEQTNLKIQFGQEIAKLKIKIAELTENVNLVEENSKYALKEKVQEIESLQQQLKHETENSSTVVKSLQKEIKEHKNAKKRFEEEIIILNNKITDMSHQIQNIEESSKRVLEEKVQEIQMLQQQFEYETKKSSDVIQKLQKDIDEQNNLKTRREQEIVSLKNTIADISHQIQELDKKSKSELEQKAQEIQTLQHKFASEAANLASIIKDLENIIEEHNKLKQQCDQEIVSLNNKIIEMSQTINNLQEHSKHTLEDKLLEIQTLHQQFSDETEKSNNMIKSLQKVIEEQINLKTHYEQDIAASNNKVVTMTQKIQEVEESSKLAVEEKVKEIQSLQQCLKKQIEEQNKLKNHYQQENVELSNKIVELTKTIKDAEESSKLALEVKIQENQLLQKQLADETKKSEHTIESLNKELEAEKHTLLKLKDDFDGRINTLNEKVLHQNKELTYLNKVITQKSETIELIQSDLIKEKQLNNELSTTCNQQMTKLNEQEVSLKTDFVKLQKELQEKQLCIHKLEKEVKNLKVYVSSLEEKFQNLVKENQKEVESLNQEIVRLNDKIIEMSQTIKNLQELSKQALEEKIQEMETQHQQFAADSGKSENIIKNLKVELEAEKYAQLKLKDDFDNRFMKLNEKVLNRNNELVELQNNIIQKSELIEVLQSDLRREKELRDELSNTCNDQLVRLNEQKNAIEMNLQQKQHEITELQKELQETKMFINKLQKENENLRTAISGLEEKGRHREVIIKEKQKEIEFLNDIFQKEQEKLNHKMDARNASIKSLQMQLQNEIEYKVQLQRELSELQTSKISLVEEIDAAKNLAKDREENILVLEKQNIEKNEQIHTNVNNVAKLEDENVLLVKEVESLKAAQIEVVNDHEAKTLMWEKQKIEINEEVQAYIRKMEELEEDKAMLLKEMEALKATQIKETNSHETKTLAWKKQKIEINEQMQVNVQKVQKLEDEKAILLKEMEVLKDAQSKLIRDHEEKMLTLEKIRDEKAMLMKAMETLGITRKEDTKTHEEKTALWKKHTNEMREQMQSNVLKIEKLENEKMMLLKDVEELKALQIKESKDYEDNALRWEKLNIEMKNQIQFNVLKVEKLEDEKTILMKKIDALKSAQTEETKAHEENVRMWEKQKIEMEKQIKDYVLKVEKLEDEKTNFMKEMETIRVALNKVTKAHEECALMWEAEKAEMEEQIKTNVLNLEKFEEEKTILIKEIEIIKAAQREEMKAHDESALIWEKQKVEMEEQIEANVLKLEKLEEEKATLIIEIVTIKTAQSEETKAYEENALLWEKQKVEMEEQIKAHVLKLEQLEEEKTTLINEIETIKTSQSEEMKAHEENALMWGKQKIEMAQQIKANVLKLENLEEEKTTLAKEIETIKTAQCEEMKAHEENARMWEKQKIEMEEQIQANIFKLVKLENEVRSRSEMEGIKTAQEGKTKDRMNEMIGQIDANDLNVKKLNEEKAILLQELEELKAAEKAKTKDIEENAVLWGKEKTEMYEQLRAKDLKVKDLEEEKAMVLKKVGELMAAEMEEEICLKKNHEGKILMLEKQETEMKEQIQANALRVEKLVEEKVILLKEVEALKAAQKELLAVASQDKILGLKYTSWEKEMQGLHHQVDTTTSDLAHSSMESLKTISDLEKIVQDKNRKITTMQTEISYIKSIMAESGIKLIDVTKELEVSKDTCHELSSQLKKIVQQKNEEIAELKRQVAKMSATENRASQIIKVSAKYQAMILKRIAEIKSSAVLKELTNFGNQNSNDAELRRSLAGSVTMEDLENFLETTDRHIKRCSEKQIALQKDRDRLSEVNRINESEIINMKKFLTEMSVSFRTFTTVKDVYNQKLSKIVSLQRTVRREILSLDGRITEATMCKLERGYAAVMQDLSECAMNLERWVDRSVSRLLSAEKIKQAFTSDLEQTSLSTCNYQNAAVEVQLSELDNSFQKLLEEISRAQKGEGAKTPQEVTIMEVRAEYEDKLNRMKAKMKELFHEEMGRLKQKQADEIAILERELTKSKEKMVESSRAYEEHIRALTTELWSVGEKFLVKQEEADWLRRKQSGSLMSLQHIHSSGLHQPQETFGRPSDTHSLRSLPMHNKKSEPRGMHMSDEEGEVFDNRFLKELAATPRASLAPGQRISELKRRNSLVPPHLKSSYPAEMQFAPTLDEEDIKCAGTSFSLARPQRKEVGITAYKKPGPPTPSKQAGRLSATDSELRESLRVEADPQGRKTSTPSRIRSLFRSNRTDVDLGTPRSRRFSSIFRKK